MHGRGLQKGTLHRRHALATLHAIVKPVRRARHRGAALYRLFRRRHSPAIERVARNRKSHSQAQNRPQTKHFYQARRLERFSQDRLSGPLRLIKR